MMSMAPVTLAPIEWLLGLRLMPVAQPGLSIPHFEPHSGVHSGVLRLPDAATPVEPNYHHFVILH